MSDSTTSGDSPEPETASSVKKPEPPGTNRFRTAVAPVPRAGAYYARSWRRYLARRDSDIPIARPTLGLAGNALLDELVLAGYRVLSRSPEGEPERIERESIAAIEMYEREGWLQHPELFHPTPPLLDDVASRPARARNITYERIEFESGYEPRIGDPARDRWLGYEANRRVPAWVLQHEEPRPWLICVHGASMGHPMIDLRLFRADRLHRELGLNVAFPVLALHGPRRRGLPKAVAFPREDTLDNVHGVAQSVWDIRRLVSWIRDRQGDVPIGITGVSLGGYVTSLVASLEDGLACAIVGVPVVDMCDMMVQHGGHHLTDDRLRVIDLARRLTSVVSPLALTPRVRFEGRFIYAGVADRLIHPRDQVVRLWEHWDRPNIQWYQGGHTGFRRSKPVGQFIVDALVRSGLVDPSHASTVLAHEDGATNEPFGDSPDDMSPAVVERGITPAGSSHRDDDQGAPDA